MVLNERQGMPEIGSPTVFEALLRRELLESFVDLGQVTEVVFVQGLQVAECEDDGQGVN